MKELKHHPKEGSRLSDNPFMKKEELAALLNGREYGNEIDEDLEDAADQSDLLVIFGYSDDNAELRGVIHDEVGCWDGGDILFTKEGKPLESVHECECDYCGYKVEAESALKVEAIWDKEGYSWTYKTALPHATFDILEDGEKYCRGIVIDMKELK